MPPCLQVGKHPLALEEFDPELGQTPLDLLSHSHVQEQVTIREARRPGGRPPARLCPSDAPASLQVSKRHGQPLKPRADRLLPRFLCTQSGRRRAARLAACRIAHAFTYAGGVIVAVDILERLATEAIGLAADTLEVEYKDGFEEVFANSGPVGFCIARLRSSSQEASRLREACDRLSRQKRPRRIAVDELEYDLRCTTYDSFGEAAFRLALRPSTGSRAGRATAARQQLPRHER